MTPKRRKKTDTANLLALANAGQLDPGAVYFDFELKKWYGAQSDTELIQMTSDAVVLYGAVGLSFEETAKPAANGAYSFLLPYAMTIPANCTGSEFYNKTNPSAEVVVSIKQNGTEFATLTVSTGGTPTWAATETELASGDRITFTFPSSQDSTWSGIVITLKGVRS